MHTPDYSTVSRLCVDSRFLPDKLKMTEPADASAEVPDMTPPAAISRGFDPQDKTVFSPEALERLRHAQQDLQFLLDRGYPMTSAAAFVGSHHQLTIRQRSALQRATDRSDLYLRRAHTQRSPERLRDGPVLIDGFNLIIALETALSGNLVVRGADGALRDLAGLRGTYRVIAQTERAIRLIGDYLAQHAVPSVRFFLDAPVSNSGRLRQLIEQLARSWRFPVQVDLVPDADRMLMGQDRIVSSDSVLLDLCQGWFNLAAWIVAERLPEAWVISLP